MSKNFVDEKLIKAVLSAISHPYNFSLEDCLAYYHRQNGVNRESVYLAHAAATILMEDRDEFNNAVTQNMKAVR